MNQTSPNNPFEIFPWDPSFNTGIEVVDRQHRKLVEILNALAAAWASAESDAVLSQTLEQLIEYAQYHFETEEGIWREHLGEFKARHEHEALHAGFGKKLQKFIDRRESTQLDLLLQELLGFLVHWLAFHIVDSDKRMAFAVEEVKKGVDVDEAMRLADERVGGTLQAMINTILSMYDRLSTRTVELLNERSARIKAEEELASSEEKWKSILAGGGDEVWELDLEHPENCAIESVGEVARLLRGADAQGSSHGTVHPEDIGQLVDDLQDHLEGKTTFFSNKHRTLKSAGQWAWVLTQGKVVQTTESGRPLRMVGTHTDITERELAGLIYAHCSQSIFIADQNQCIQSTNPAFQESTGWLPADVAGVGFMDFLKLDVEPASSNHLFEILKANGLWEGEQWIRRKDGSSFCAYLSIRTSPDLGHSEGHFIGLIQDITAQKEADRAIRRNQRLDAMGQLTGGISHDFNNILAVILGNLELVTEEIDSECLKQRIDRVSHATHRAINLTGKLLDFSRGTNPHKAVLDVAQLVQGMDGLMRKSVTPEIEIEIDCYDDLWRIEADPGDLENALLNLIINSRDALAGPGEIKIELSNQQMDEVSCSRYQLPPGDYVRIRVSDNGCGIPDRIMEKVFEPFFTTKDETRGTGLGLSMVFGFVQRSGGMIDCQSKQGVGTTFTILLPRTLEQIAEVKAPPVGEKKESASCETILVVDDEPELRNIAKEALTRQGYQVLLAEDGKAALQHLENGEAIDLLLTDLVMPGGIPGDQLARKALSMRQDIKVLLASGYLTSSETMGQMGDFEMLEKPYRISELVAKVNTILNSP